MTRSAFWVNPQGANLDKGLNEYETLETAARQLGLKPHGLVAIMRSHDPPMPVFLDCGSAKLRSGISVWQGVLISEGVEKLSWAMPARPTPLSDGGMDDLESRMASGEKGLTLLEGLEILIQSEWGPKERAITDESGEPIPTSDGGIETAPLSEEEIEEKRMPIDFRVRLKRSIHGTANRPPNPTLKISGVHLDLIRKNLEQSKNTNDPPGPPNQRGAVEEIPYTTQKGQSQNFFPQIPRTRRPHSDFIATLDFKKVSSGKSWLKLKNLASESKGTKQIDLPGYGLIYMKLDSKEPSKKILYKDEPFEGPRDPHSNPITKKAFYNAWDRAKKL